MVEAEPTYAFSATVVNITEVASLLKALSFCDKVNIVITQDGLKCTSEEGKYVQASAFLRKDIFQEFHLNTRGEEDDLLCFKVLLKEIIEFLKMFCYHDVRYPSTTTSAETFAITKNKTAALNQGVSLKMQYAYVGGPFTLVLDEIGTITDFTLKTEEIDELMVMEIDPLCRLIMKSEALRELFGEIEAQSPEFLQIKVVPNKRLQFSGETSSGSGFMKIRIPYDSQDAFDSFESDAILKAIYNFPILRYSFKALGLSEKTALKLDSNGLLCFSFLMNSSTESCVEFYCFARIPPDEEEEEG